MSETKTCSCCLRTLSTRFFYLNEKCISGRHSWCKKCVRAYNTMCRVKKAQEQGETIQKRIYVYKKRPVVSKKNSAPDSPCYPISDFLQTFD